MQKSIKQILIDRNNMTESAADQLISEAREAMQECLANNDQDSAYNICEEYFGLEPDYIDELL